VSPKVVAERVAAAREAEPPASGPTPLGELVLRLQDGDESALQPLIEQTQDMAFRLAFSLLQDRHAAEDVLQDVYWAVYRDIRALRSPAAFRTWFVRIVTHRARRLLRRQRPASLQALAEEGLDPSVPGHEAALTARIQVHEALGDMSAIDRSVLVLREVLQFSYQEIAETLDIQMGTVKSRLSEARRRLLERWKG
jgi:RNA polymerase sigma-70 factor (ECF subfamily)